MISNATIYRFKSEKPLQLDLIADSLGRAQFVPTGPTQQASSGWVPPRGEEHAPLIESVDNQWILRLRKEVRKVPSATVKRRAEEIAEQMEKNTGRKPGKKIMKELKEQALLELLPMAFTSCADTVIWIDAKSEFVVIDTGSCTRADEIVTLLVNTIEGLAMSLVQTEMSPAVAMTHWLSTGEPPYQFTIDRECELKSTDEMKSIVRYSRHTLDSDEVKQHVISGKVPTKLALTWRDRVSIVLHDSGVLKKVSFLDVVFESAKAKSGSIGAGEAFDADAAIATGELRELIPDLFEALGGEQLAMGLSPVAGASAPAPQKQESDKPDPLYPDACDIVVSNQRASISLVQRHLLIGYNRAAHLIEQMERGGLIGPMKEDGSRDINDLVNVAKRKELAPWS